MESQLKSCQRVPVGHIAGCVKAGWDAEVGIMTIYSFSGGQGSLEVRYACIFEWSECILGAVSEL